MSSSQIETDYDHEFDSPDTRSGESTRIPCSTKRK